MPPNASVFRVTQLGMEAANAPGTAVAATKRLLATEIVPRPRIPATPFRPMGLKLPTTMIREKEHTEAAITGRMAFNDLLYLYSSLITKATPTVPATPAQAVLTHRWVMAFNNSGPDAPQTFTVENGSSVNATQFTYGLVNSLQLRITEVETAVTGQMLGTITTEPFTLTTSGVTDVAVHEIGPMNVDVFVGTASNSLVQLDVPLEVELNIADRYTMVRTLDTRNPSVSEFVEKAPTITARLLMEHDAVSQAYLANLRNVDTRFMRILVTGPIIETITATDFHYRFVADFPFKFGEPTIGNRNDLWTGDWVIQPIYSGGAGLTITIDTPLAAL